MAILNRILGMLRGGASRRTGPGRRPAGGPPGGHPGPRPGARRPRGGLLQNLLGRARRL